MTATLTPTAAAAEVNALRALNDACNLAILRKMNAEVGLELAKRGINQALDTLSAARAEYIAATTHERELFAAWTERTGN